VARTRFAGRSRPAAAIEGDGRRAWLTLLDLLRDHARRVLAGDAIDAFEAGGLQREVERMRAPFPLRHASAVWTATALLGLARAFVAAGLPEDRAALARLVGAVAAYLDQQLVAQGHALAQASRRRAGDPD
jgi:hypothetical protein